MTSVPQPIDLPWFTGRHKKLAFTLQDVFSKDECDALINRSEKAGYSPALINAGAGRQVLMSDVRNNTRCIIDDEDLAGQIWDRIKQHIPEEYQGHRVVGINERLRFLRYHAGQFFDRHCDGRYMRTRLDTNDESKLYQFSALTVQIYLNSGCEGGATRFLNPRDESQFVDCNPVTGQVLVFEQNGVLHEGSLLSGGCKYTIRTEVMYAPCTHPSR